MEIHFKAAIYAIFAASGGAIFGSLLDSHGNHTVAQTAAIFCAVGVYAWRLDRG
jgi:hypothetical protein